MDVQTPLYGHVSPETAFVIEDYPYGGLRCKKRVWLEQHPKRGFRLVSQTTNPKKGHIWNKPKASTYAGLCGAMYLDSAGHVQWAAVHEYSRAADAEAFLQAFPEVFDRRLLDWATSQRFLLENMLLGTIRYTVNGTPIETTEPDRERWQRDRDTWARVESTLDGRA